MKICELCGKPDVNASLKLEFFTFEREYDLCDICAEKIHKHLSESGSRIKCEINELRGGER